MPIFRVKSVKIYTGQKKFTRICSWGSRQIWGMLNRLEVIPYNPMIAHPTQIFQATREARLISEDVETPSVEDEGLGAEEVLLVTITKFTTSTKFTDTLFMKRLFCHKIMIFLTFTLQTTTGYVWKRKNRIENAEKSVRPSKTGQQVENIPILCILVLTKIFIRCKNNIWGIVDK